MNMPVCSCGPSLFISVVLGLFQGSSISIELKGDFSIGV
jgi:hypothetical protein